MSHPSSRQYSYSAQFGFLLIFLCAGFIIGNIAAIVPLLGKINWADIHSGSSNKLMDNLLAPQNATALMWSQFLLSLFLFFVPCVLYALVCHKKPFTHLGFIHHTSIIEIIFVIVIMIAGLPLVDALSQLTEKIPIPKSAFQYFKSLEDDYDKQVAVFTQMKTVGDYITSLIVVAFLPAVFEETIFRGAIQNLLTRWFKMPLLAVVITSIIFSAVHLSYFGFLSRAALGFVLGWIYYRTGNIWLNILGHFTNNAIAVTSMYFAAKSGLSSSDADQHFPLWMGLLSTIAVIVLFIFFEKISAKDIDRPGEEVLMPGIDHYNNPFENNPDNRNLN